MCKPGVRSTMCIIFCSRPALARSDTPHLGDEARVCNAVEMLLNSYNFRQSLMCHVISTPSHSLWLSVFPPTASGPQAG